MLTSSGFRAKRTKVLVGVVTVVVAAGALLAVPANAASRSVKTAAAKCADPSGTVKIGVVLFGGVATNVQGVGGNTSLTPKDQAIVDNFKRGADALTAAGGLAGCKVEAVVHDFSAQAGDFNLESQKECTDFTQDNKVIAVFTNAYETKNLIDCLGKAKVPVFAFAGLYPPTCADYKTYAGYLYNPIGVASCRFAAFPGIWKKAGLFPPNPKVGILALDDGSGEGAYIANKVYTPALTKLKIPSETFSYPTAVSAETAAKTSAALSSAVLRFKTDGVNVVIMTPSAAQGPAFFIPQAQAQNFFPNYGFTTSDALMAIAQIPAAAAGVKKGISISWSIADLPLSTLIAAKQLPPNPAITRCAKWADPGMLTQAVFYSYCDFINVLAAAFKGATKTDAATLRKGIEALGTSFDSSTTFGGATKFGKGRYDAVSAAQLLQFNPTTKAFEYLKPNQKPTPIP
jgi:hypothetical protein